MVRAPGTTLDDPMLLSTMRPDLDQSLHDIKEYLEEQNAYDLFDCLLKELVSQQPADPVQFMLDYLKADCPKAGLLRVVVSRAPGIGCSILARRLANAFGLAYINAGQLLREKGLHEKAEAATDGQFDKQIADMVIAKIKEANQKHAGVVLDGFPRTRLQTSYLQEHRIVPTHVLVVKATEGEIYERHRRIKEGEILNVSALPQDVLTRKLSVYASHAGDAIEVYKDLVQFVDADPAERRGGAEATFSSMVNSVRRLLRSTGPQLPPRVVVLGARGSGDEAHARDIAARLGAIFVDGSALQEWAEAVSAGRPAPPGCLLDVPIAHSAAATDVLGIIGVRLRMKDCSDRGWVLCGAPVSVEVATKLADDAFLRPTRVLVVKASEESCVKNRSLQLFDPVSCEVYVAPPAQPDPLAQRLRLRPQDEPSAVISAYSEYSRVAGTIVKALSGRGRVFEVDAGAASAEAVLAELINAAERPLPLPVV